MSVVFYYVICYFIVFPFIFLVIFAICLMVRPVGRGHFVICVGVELCFEAKSWVWFGVLVCVWIECSRFVFIYLLAYYG